MILILIPVKNEEARIGVVALSLSEFCSKNLGCDYRLVFIDDKSADKTFEILKNLNIQHKVVMRNSFDRGKGSALKTAYILSNSSVKLKDDDLIVFMDGDGQIDPQEITTFLKLGELFNADIVIGNKRHKYSRTLYGIKRKIISKGYNFMIRMLFGLNFEDTQCGLKVFRKKALDEVIADVNIKQFAFDIELLVACRAKGVRIIDAPVYIKRKLNRGSVGLKSIIQTFIDTMRIWYRKQKGYYG